MDIKSKIRSELRAQYGEFVTPLENIYENKITQTLIDGNIEEKKAWLTYNQVVLEIKNSTHNDLFVKELQYKLTDEIDPNDVCIEIIQRVDKPSLELKRLYYKIKNFI
jgi:arginine utilization protein RocB